ncbi:MAG: DUF4157 domain-containing protein [Bacteroidetes bacterium]|nr:DUF4157 domain-containing protein [Bacteroidota bacterium]
MTELKDIKIKERSWRARLAAWCLGVDNVAFTLGKTILLHNATKAQFLLDEKWVKHEMKHVEQFRRYGYFSFILKYTIETMRKGYYNNKYEVEARQAERY